MSHGEDEEAEVPLDERAFAFVTALDTDNEGVAAQSVRKLEEEARGLTPAERFQEAEVEALRTAAGKVQRLMRLMKHRGELARTLRELQLSSNQTRVRIKRAPK